VLAIVVHHEKPEETLTREEKLYAKTAKTILYVI
jgi:hypothetical protein